MTLSNFCPIALKQIKSGLNSLERVSYSLQNDGTKNVLVS